MPAGIKATIDHLRGVLDGMPDAVTFAELPPGMPPTEVPAGVPAGLAAVLEVTDGPRCGSLVFWAASEISGDQFRATELEGGSGRWICIGSCDHVPIFANRESGEVAWSPEEDGDLVRLSSGVVAFFAEYALGPGYARITSADDWFDLLRAEGVVVPSAGPWQEGGAGTLYGAAGDGRMGA